MDRLKGKIILISGGARGQGAAEARLFVTEGARVIIGDVLEPEGRQLASELGHSATFVRHDVTQEMDWETAVNAAEKLGGLHGLVNNAGIYQPRTLMETETELLISSLRGYRRCPSSQYLGYGRLDNRPKQEDKQFLRH